MRQNPAPYSLPIIPRPLPSEIVDGEHFVTTDMISLIAGNASPSGDPEAETSNQEQVSRAPSVPSSSTSGDPSPASPRPSQGERGIFPTRLPLSREGDRVLPPSIEYKKERDKSGEKRSRGPSERFCTWVRLEPNWPSASEEEEEEEEMTGLLDRYATRKQKRQEDAERVADRAEGLSRLPTNGDSVVQAFVISGSLEMGSSDQLGPEDVALEEPRGIPPIPPTL